MIEADILPALVTVTITALVTEAAGMYIIEAVAIIAGRRRTLIALRSMATVAGHFHMLATQTKIGIFMIEIMFFPALHVMAVGTALTQVALVNVISRVTGRARL
jgi:hypothetical protein